jgi:type III secretion protein U
MAEERTEEPTPKKLEKAREQGQVAKSADVVECACIAAMLLVLHIGGHYLSGSMQAIVRYALDFVVGDHSLSSVMASLGKLEHAAIGMMLPVAVTSVAAALLALAPQTGLQATMEPISPNFDKVSPATGFKRIFSMKSLLELLKMLIKALVVFIVMWKTIAWLLPLIGSSLYLPVQGVAKILWTAVLRMLDVSAVVYLVIAAADYAIQKWSFTRQNRMSKDDVKRETKDSEGDPKIKQERRKLAREFSTAPPPQLGISRANMLVVNPTHYAVAVRYEPRETPLPVIVARGVDEEAAHLRHLALSAGVPIVSNPPVARALYKIPLNQPVPGDLLEVVAAILRWVDGVGAQRARKENA